MRNSTLFEKLLHLLLFLLPWQTVYIVQQGMIDGHVWQYATISWYVWELLLWLVVLIYMYQSAQRILKEKKSIAFQWSIDRQFMLSLFVLSVYIYVRAYISSSVDVGVQWALRFLSAVLLFLTISFSKVDKRKMIKWFALGAVVPALLSIWQFSTQLTFASTLFGITEHLLLQPGTSVIQSDAIGRWLRAYGSFPHPNILGGYMVSVLTALFSIRMQKERVPSWIYPVAVLCSISLVLSFSRSAWLSLLLLLLFSFVARSAMQRRLVFVIGVTCALVMFVNAPLVHTRFSVQSPHEVASISERGSALEDAKQLLIAQPFFGVGPGQYTGALQQVRPEYQPWEYQPVHNVLVLFLVELGIVGALLLAFVCIMCVRFFAQTHRFSHTSMLLLSMTPIVLLDHYYLSLPIGLVLFSVTCALTLHK